VTEASEPPPVLGHDGDLSWTVTGGAASRPSGLSPRLAAQLARAKRVLLVRLRSLGDAVLMTPVPTALKAWRPELHVAVLMEPPFETVLRRHPAVDDVIVAPPRQARWSRIRLFAGIRRARFDLVVNLHSGPTAGLLTALSGAPLRVAYARARFAAACNVRIPSPRTLWGVERAHTVRHQLSPLVHLGIPLPCRIELALSVDPAARDRVAAEMAERGLRPGRFVVLQAFSGWPTKEWDVARFAELSRRLRESYRVPVVALPAPNETGKFERLSRLAPDILGLPGRSLEEMLAWIEQCGLFVGNDSGPGHVAAAFKKKTLVISGSADPSVWHPWGTEHQLVSSGLPCIPCPGDRCYEFERPVCLERISVAMALDAAARLRPFQPSEGDER
jgi:ADP-heptose:LPS heptosyltransferase